ncbi:hypothetical protein AB0939_16815 [Streptomyces sp. NPDC006990]|uniref:hypothetical protein n=1 Tax=unclassified Streptomyces TaxID=2593676 RepID=UPI003456E6CA
MSAFVPVCTLVGVTVYLAPLELDLSLFWTGLAWPSRKVVFSFEERECEECDPAWLFFFDFFELEWLLHPVTATVSTSAPATAGTARVHVRMSSSLPR